MRTSGGQRTKKEMDDPIYYEKSLFEGWDYHSIGWSPALNEATQREPYHDTSTNCFDVIVQTSSTKAMLQDGPETQCIKLWRGGFGGYERADEKVTIECSTHLYIVFFAVLRDPDKFL